MPSQGMSLICHLRNSAPVLYEAETLSGYGDVDIVTKDGEKFSLSRLVLASMSNALKSILLDTDTEGREVILTEMTRSELSVVLDFLISGFLPGNITPEIVKNCKSLGINIFKIKLEKVPQSAIPAFFSTNEMNKDPDVDFENMSGSDAAGDCEMEAVDLASGSDPIVSVAEKKQEEKINIDFVPPTSKPTTLPFDLSAPSFTALLPIDQLLETPLGILCDLDKMEPVIEEENEENVDFKIIHQWKKSCLWCRKVFTEEDEYQFHRREISCRRSYLTSNKKRKVLFRPLPHLIEKPPPVPCHWCEQLFDKDELKSHLESVACSRLIMGESRVRDLKAEPEFICRVCGKKCKSNYKLMEHFTHHEPKNLICPQCGKLFRNQNVLKYHLKQHDRTPVQCEICGQEYSSPGGLTSHKKEVHFTEEDLVFKCRHCDKRFASKQKLRIHEPIHLQLKPHKCRVCGLAFNATSNRSTHIKRSHPEEFAKAKAERKEREFVSEKRMHMFKE